MSVWAQDPTTPILHTIGLAGVGSTIASFFGYLPAAFTVIAATVTIVAYVLTIMDNPRVKLWTTKRKQRRVAAEIAKLRALQRVTQAQLDALERSAEVKAQGEATVQAVVEQSKELLKH